MGAHRVITDGRQHYPVPYSGTIIDLDTTQQDLVNYQVSLCPSVCITVGYMWT